MNETRRNTYVGAFVILGLVALGWLMSSFGELPAFLGKGEYELIVVAENPSGIGEGTSIFLSGVQIGRVKGLQFKDPAHLDAGVEIVCLIERDYVIPRTAKAEIQPAGMGLGRGQINILVQAGEAEPLPQGRAILGSMVSPWGDLIPETMLTSVETTVSQLGEFVAALTPVAQDLHLLLERHSVADVDNPVDEAKKITANISTVVERLDTTLKNFNDTFGDPEIRAGWLEVFRNIRGMSEDGRLALANIRSMTADLRVDLERISTKLEAGIDNTSLRVDEIAAQVTPVLENAAKLSAALYRIVQGIEQGDGSAGRFVNDPRLYESLTLSAERLIELLETLERIFAKFERDGAIGINAKTPIGPIRRDYRIPEQGE